jgi:hypothetical protein
MSTDDYLHARPPSGHRPIEQYILPNPAAKMNFTNSPPYGSPHYSLPRIPIANAGKFMINLV